MNPHKVFFVDDHPLIIEGLSALVATSDGLDVCGSAQSVEQALRQICDLQPDVALVDLSMDGGSGLELIRQIHQMHPQTRIIVVSMYEEAVYGVPAMNAGAMGFVNKREAANNIIDAIRSVLNDEPYFQYAKLAAHSAPGALSGRELQVFELVAHGRTVPEIAVELNRSVKTIETHREHIKEKLGLSSSHALTVYAVKWLQGTVA